MQHAGLRRQLAQHSPFGAGRAANSARCVVTRANRKASALSNLLAKDAPVTKLEWSKPLEIVKYPDPRLRAKNARVGVFDETLAALAADMMDVMYEDDGVGLAAPQVGVNVRLMVFNESGKRGSGQEMVLVNPEIVSSSKTTELDVEGCLSFPKIYGDVERSTEIVVKAQDAKGQPVSLTLKGFVARVFQHEFDHLQGALFHDRMKPNVFKTVKDQLVAMEEEYLKTNPGAKIQRCVVESKGFGAK